MSPLLTTRGAGSATGFGRLFSAVLESFDSIATANITSAVSSITFSSIPQTYAHLHLRMIAKANSNSGYNGTLGVRARFNGDTNGNYEVSNFYMLSYAPADSNAGGTSETGADIGIASDGDTGGNMSGNYGVSFCTILDYTNTNKFKMTRSFEGDEHNGTGYYRLQTQGSVWKSTSAITSMTVYINGADFKQYSQVALYGIRE